MVAVGGRSGGIGKLPPRKAAAGEPAPDRASGTPEEVVAQGLAAGSRNAAMRGGFAEDGAEEDEIEEEEEVEMEEERRRPEEDPDSPWPDCVGQQSAADFAGGGAQQQQGSPSGAAAKALRNMNAFYARALDEFEGYAEESELKSRASQPAVVEPESGSNLGASEAGAASEPEGGASAEAAAGGPAGVDAADAAGGGRQGRSGRSRNSGGGQSSPSPSKRQQSRLRRSSSTPALASRGASAQKRDARTQPDPARSTNSPRGSQAGSTCSLGVSSIRGSTAGSQRQLHYPRGSCHFHTSVRLALDGAAVEYYEQVARLLEHAHTEEEEWHLLKQANQSPRFAEALGRQGLELEELGPSSFLSPQRRAALLAAVLQERDDINSAGAANEFDSASRKMSRLLRARLTAHLQKAEAQEGHRRDVLDKARCIAVKQLKDQEAYNASKVERANNNLAKSREDQARRKSELQTNHQYVDSVAQWKREQEFELSDDLQKRLMEANNRSTKHMQQQKCLQDQHRQLRRQKSAETNHQVDRMNRIHEHRELQSCSSVAEDNKVYITECQHMINALRSMPHPRQVKSFLQKLDAMDRRRASSTNCSVDCGSADEEGLDELGAGAFREESLNYLPGSSGQQRHMLQESLRQPISLRDSVTSSRGSGASGGGASGARMLRQRRENGIAGSSEEAFVATGEGLPRPPSEGPLQQTAKEPFDFRDVCGDFPCSPLAATDVDTDLPTPLNGHSVGTTAMTDETGWRETSATIAANA